MPKTLLLADDSVTIQKVVGISFASEDITLVTVDNGDDAIARAKSSKPDLILADVVMPGRNGYEVCEAVKADPELAHIPVLLLTGTFEAFDEARAASAGAAGHVSKPFEAQTLVDQVKRLLAESPAPRPAAQPAAAPTPAPTATPTAAPTAAPTASEAVAASPRPAPVADPASSAPPAPPAASLEDSFDFFDDDVQELATPAAPAPDDALEIDSSESAFAFGEDELSLPEPAPEPEALSIGSLSDRPAGDRTVAILPDEPSSDSDHAVMGREVAFGADDLAPFGSSLDDEALETADEAESLAPAEAAAAGSSEFDFDFESETPVPSVPDFEEPLVPDDAADLAQETILDPNGASGYDVSSSDLGDPLAIGPSPAPPAESRRPAEPAEISAPTAPRVESTDLSDLADLPDLFESPRSAEESHTGLTDEPMEAASEPLRQPFGVDPSPLSGATTQPSRRHGTAPPADVPPPIPVAGAEPEPDAPLIEAEPLSDLGAAGIGASEPVPAPASASAALAPASASSAEVLEELAPKLRAQLHDTLEKIAWESFSDLTETIVRQAVERVERVAWEVIPQLAETLVREEIRRMKGDEDS